MPSSIFKLLALIFVFAASWYHAPHSTLLGFIVAAAWLGEASHGAGQPSWREWLGQLVMPAVLPFYGVLGLALMLGLPLGSGRSAVAAPASASSMCGGSAGPVGAACGCGSGGQAAAAPLTVKPTAAMNRTLVPPPALPKPRGGTVAPQAGSASPILPAASAPRPSSAVAPVPAAAPNAP